MHPVYQMNIRIHTVNLSFTWDPFHNLSFLFPFLKLIYTYSQMLTVIKSLKILFFLIWGL